MNVVHTGTKPLLLRQLLVDSIHGLSLRQAEKLLKQGGVRTRDNNQVLSSPKHLVPPHVFLIVDLSCLDTREQTTKEYLQSKRQDLVQIASHAHWSVIRKPAGLHSVAQFFGDTLHFSWFAKQMIEANRAWPLPAMDTLPDYGLMHRLDVGTSGAMLIAHDTDTYTYFLEARKQGVLERIYWALVPGQFPWEEYEINEPVAHHPTKESKMIVPGKFACHKYRGNLQSATTMIRRISYSKHASLLAVRIKGGRRHQIRVHLAHIGFPIYGDGTYGVLASERLGLHAVCLKFICPQTKQPKQFFADPGTHFWAFAKEFECKPFLE